MSIWPVGRRIVSATPRIAVLITACVVVACTTAPGSPSATPGLGVQPTAAPSGPAPTTSQPTPASSPRPRPTPIPVLAGEPWLLHDAFVQTDVKGILLVRPDGSHDHRILVHVKGDVRAPTWSSDGTRIAFVYRGPGAAQDGEIWTAAADGTGAAKLTDGAPDCTGAFYPAWAPGDRTLAFVCYTSDGNSSVAVYDPETKAITHLVKLTYPEVLDNPPRWSPDGSTIAFDVLRWNSTDSVLDGSLVATVPAAGGPVKRLTAFETFAAYPDWSPDGTELVFNTYDQGNMVGATEPSNLYAIGLDGTGLRQLTTASKDGTYRITQPRWDAATGRIWVTIWRPPSITIGWVDPATGAVTNVGSQGARPQPRPLP